MSKTFVEIVVLSDSELDSDIEELVNAAFAKAKEKIRSKKSEHALSNVNRKTVTTTTGETWQTSSSTKSKDNAENSLQTDISERNSTEDDSSFSFFIDTKPSINRFSEEVVQELANSDESETDGSSGETESENEAKDKGLLKKKDKDGESSDDSEVEVKSSKKSTNELSSSLQTGLDLDDIYVNVRSFQNPQTSQHIDLPGILLSKKHDEIMKKSVITPDFEKQDKVLPYSESIRRLKMKRRKERATTKGSNWFNMPATELTDERKNDLKVLQMRHALDPKRFYRANDMRGPPKYFQFGTVVESKADFYSSRIPKKQRKATLVDELMADADFRKYNKRKYAEIQEAKRMGKGPYQKIRFGKKKKKTK